MRVPIFRDATFNGVTTTHKSGSEIQSIVASPGTRVVQSTSLVT